jgi:hypothetical protein
MDKVIKELLERVKEDGVSTASVSDGRIFIFSKQKLEELLKACENKEQVIVFIKDPSKLN